MAILNLSLITSSVSILRFSWSADCCCHDNRGVVCRLCDLVLFEEVTDDGITPPPAAAAAVAYLLSKEEDVVLATVSWQSGDITSNDEDGQSRERSMFIMAMVNGGQWLSMVHGHYDYDNDRIVGTILLPL